MDQDSNSLSQLIRRRRSDLGLTSAQLADQAGVQRSVVSRVENGTKVPQPETLAQLAAVLQLPLADLYDAAGYPLPERLPSLRPYLRRAYGVSGATADEIERYLQRISAEYGTASEPLNGEDEQPEQ